MTKKSHLILALLTLVEVFGLSNREANAENILSQVLRCNQGVQANYEDMLDDSRPFRSELAFINESCLEVLAASEDESVLGIAKAMGNSDAIMRLMDQSLFDEYLVENVSYGNRFAFKSAIKTEEYLVAKLSKSVNLEERQLFKSILSFVASSNHNDDKKFRLATNLTAEDFLSYQQIVFSMGPLRQYCMSQSCVIESEADLCNFISPIKIKSMFLKDEKDFWRSIKNCSRPDILLVANLRSIGILDGKCSIALQTNGFVKSKRMKVDSCDELIRNLSSYDFEPQIDGVLFLRSNYTLTENVMVAKPGDIEILKILRELDPGLSDLIEGIE